MDFFINKWNKPTCVRNWKKDQAMKKSKTQIQYISYKEIKYRKSLKLPMLFFLWHTASEGRIPQNKINCRRRPAGLSQLSKCISRWFIGHKIYLNSVMSDVKDATRYCMFDIINYYLNNNLSIFSQKNYNRSTTWTR